MKIALCTPFLALALTAAAQTAPPPPKPFPVSPRVQKLVAGLTLDEKILLISGANNMSTEPIPRLNIPALHMADGPVGCHVPQPSTAYAAGIGLAASWDMELARQIGVQLGRDCRSRGAAFLLGPGVNIYRAPMNGRNFEYFGEDPLLAGRIATAYVDGLQSEHVSGTVKHYLGNNSEYYRNTVNTVLDERTLREIYLPAFEATVKNAHAGALMDSYNLINGEHATANRYINTTILKDEWGFDGVMMSDWGAAHDTIADANSGLDLEMPDDRYFSAEALMPAIRSGKVSEAQITDKVTRILALADRMGWLDAPQVNTNISRFNTEGDALTLRAAEREMVLLKNDRNMLPLDRTRIRKVAVIGPDAWPGVPTGGGSGDVLPFRSVSLITGVAGLLGPSVNVTYDQGAFSPTWAAKNTHWSKAPDGKDAGITVEEFSSTDFTGTPLATTTERQMLHGERYTIDPEDFHPGIDTTHKDHPHRDRHPQAESFKRWTAYYSAAKDADYDVVVEDGSNYRLLVDGAVTIDDSRIPYATLRSKTLHFAPGPHKVVFEEWSGGHFGGSSIRVGIVPADGWVTPEAKRLASEADIVLLSVGFDTTLETEGADRSFELPIGQQRLIPAISAANRNTVVLITSGGAVEAASWLDAVPAVMETWYGGQQGGAAAARVLFGDAAPGGRLPISWERKISDNPTFETYYPAPGTLDVPYKEGVFVGYRGYQHTHTRPLFQFGFGLSYSTFAYSNLHVQPGPGDTVATVSFDVRNTGSRQDTDVAQVYVAPPDGSPVPRPEEELKAFASVELQPGESKHIELPLNTRAFTYFDTAAKEWTAPAGNYEIRVGRSSEDIALRGKMTLNAPMHADLRSSKP